MFQYLNKISWKPWNSKIFMFHLTTSGSSMKDVRSQGRRGCVQCGYFADKKGVFRCGRLHFLVQKIRTSGREVEPVRTKWGQFSRVCEDVFYGRPFNARQLRSRFWLILYFLTVLMSIKSDNHARVSMKTIQR